MALEDDIRSALDATERARQALKPARLQAYEADAPEDIWDDLMEATRGLAICQNRLTNALADLVYGNE